MAEETPRRYCSTCGHTLKPEDPFCPNCGTPVHRARAPSPPRLVPNAASNAAPPPAAQPPGPLGSRWLILILALVTFFGLGAALSEWVGMPRLLFVSQIGLLTSTICTVPTIASNVAGEQRRFARMTLQILSFVVLIVGFGLWVFGTEALGIWITYAVALILLLEVGGHVIQWYLDRTLSSLSSSRVGSNMRDAATAIENMFRRESILYVAVPLGLVVGTIVGLFRRLSPQEIVSLCLQIVLLVASAILLWFLTYTCIRMADPLFRRSSLRSPMIADEPLRERAGASGTVLKVIASGTPAETENQDREDFDLASVATELRKIYLCDALHNLILIVAFAAAVLSLWGITVGVVSFALGSAVGAVVFNQLPYMVGQVHLRSEVLKGYRNSKRVDMAEELKKYAPLYPNLEFLTVLVSTPTAGGAVYFLFSNLRQ